MERYTFYDENHLPRVYDGVSVATLITRLAKLEDEIEANVKITTKNMVGSSLDDTIAAARDVSQAQKANSAEKQIENER